MIPSLGQVTTLFHSQYLVECVSCLQGENTVYSEQRKYTKVRVGYVRGMCELPQQANHSHVKSCIVGHRYKCKFDPNFDCIIIFSSFKLTSSTHEVYCEGFVDLVARVEKQHSQQYCGVVQSTN